LTPLPTRFSREGSSLRWPFDPKFRVSEGPLTEIFQISGTHSARGAQHFVLRASPGSQTHVAVSQRRQSPRGANRPGANKKKYDVLMKVYDYVCVCKVGVGEAGTSSAIAPRSARKHRQAKRGFATAVARRSVRDRSRPRTSRPTQQRRSLRGRAVRCDRRSRALAMLASSMPGSQTLASDPRTADPDPGIRGRRPWVLGSPPQVRDGNPSWDLGPGSGPGNLFPGPGPDLNF